MGNIASSPSYLLKNPSGYVFRYCVPADIKPCLNRSELRFSLRTGCIGIAKDRARAMAVCVQMTVQEIRSQGPAATMEPDRLYESLSQRLRGVVMDPGPKALDIFPLVQGTRQQPTIPTHVDHPSSQPISSVSFPDFESETHPQQQSPTISEVFALYLKEGDKAGGWTQKTKAEIVAILDLFVEIVGDIPIEKVDRSVMRGFKQTLMKLPPNMSKLKEYRGKSVIEILAMDIEKTLSTTSINKYLTKVSTVFKYAVKNGFISMNPAQEMQIPKRRRDDEQRKIFTPDDLIRLFHSAEYMEDAHRHSYAFWTPIIAAFTGCRLEEICQLHLEDVRIEDGVWVVDINDAGEKRVKSLAAKRLVPLHPFLIEDLGFGRRVEELKGRGEKRLFPELTLQRDGYGQLVSKWFARFKKRCGVVESGKTFHSFRHTFITALKHSQVDPYMLHEIDGHAIDSMTMGRYGKRFTPQVLYESAILKLDYKVDLSHLKNSRFVVHG